jgi:hypothetical protein
MTGNLIIPRVEVLWGDVNLTSYSGGTDFPSGEPLVYNCQASLSKENTNPTGQFNWNPSGPAFAVYESFLTTKVKDLIKMRFFYANGKTVTFTFVWSGQSISYGNDMNVVVKLTSEVQGLVNSNQRSVALAYDTPATFLNAGKKMAKQFAVDGSLKIGYEEAAKLSLTKATLNNAYVTNKGFASAFSTLMYAQGNRVTSHNIGEAGFAVFSPFSHGNDTVVIDGSTVKTPEPTKVYGYILGPAIIDSIDRESNWTPPQKTTTGTPSASEKVTKPQGLTASQQNPATVPQQQQEKAAKKTSSPLGTSNSHATPGIQNADNPNGAEKQQALQEENQSKLSCKLFMCPVLTGVKPNDVLYIPSLSGKYIEDWVVNQVTYQQTDGAVGISLDATRPYGLGNLMNSKGAWAAEKAKTLKTLEDWEKYAWSFNLGSTPVTSRVLPVPATPTAQAEAEFSTTRTAATG